jgi:hypothetical protein
MAPLSLSGSALDKMLAIGEDSEQGLVQMDGSGTVVFHSRSSLLSGHATSAATLGDDPAETAYADLVLRYDDTDLYSRVIVAREGGAERLAEDAAAASTYGPRTLSRSGLTFDSDDDSESAAGYLLQRYKDPALRPVQVKMLLGSDDAYNTAVLARETHHDHVLVKRRPPGGGTITLDAHIEGIAYSIRPSAPWEVTFDLIPAYEQQFFIIGTDAIGDPGGTGVLAW